jgi:protein-L-isoaspartate(D-aspartate) O-methyltransferase
MSEERSIDRIEAHRSFFATLITFNAGVTGPGNLQMAFASTPREVFLGKGPWKVLTRLGYIETPSDDPAFVYYDAAIAIEPRKNINNGQPSLHALCLAALHVKEGETVTHIGSGTGYYTAILSKLTGPRGSVYAFEIEPELAGRAVRNLMAARNVTVYNRSASEGELPLSDIIYVSAGTTGPLSTWLQALRAGGRLLLPLTPARGAGAMLLVSRNSSGTFEAKFLCSAMFIECSGARDDQLADRLTDSFARGDSKCVRSLRLSSTPDDTCWFEGRAWWLSTGPAM